jgi:hypothetical protein
VTGKKQRIAGVAGWSPVTRLGVWVGSTVLIGLMAHVAWELSGAELSLLESSTGRSVLVVAALATLLGLMSTDRRPLAEYGVFVGPDWMPATRRGLLAGAGFFALYHLAGWGTGAFRWTPEALVWRTFASTLEILITALPMAACQQLIFSGYLLGLLRSVAGRSLALIGSGVLFAAASVLGKGSDALWSADGGWLFTNLTLLAVLLGLLRLQTGSIVLPTGILAGGLIVRRAVWKTHLLTPVDGHPWVDWFQRAADTRSGPLLGGLLLVGVAAAWRRLLRTGEPALPRESPALDATFKKFLPFSNMLALAPLDLWLARLREARWRIEPIYWLRLVWVLGASAINTLLTLPERWLAPLLVRHRVPDPVLIVGVHRSGTTHLHNLLALDPQFAVPRNYQVLNPWGALLAGWLITPLLGLFMSLRRPMDAVRVHLFSPQEEEFAVAGMTRLSPYWGFLFPREIDRFDRCIHPDDLTPAEQREWETCLLHFLRKVTFWRRRPPLLKSPYNTARVAAFQRLFPRAKFIHIYRHPQATYLSNRHLAAEGLVAFQMQDPDPHDNYVTRFLEHYRRQEEAFYRAAAALPPQAVAEVKYEALTADPLGEIRRLYAELGLEYSPVFDRRLRRYLESVADYTGNKHPRPSPEISAEIERHMGEYLDRWGYRSPPPTSLPSRAA